MTLPKFRTLNYMDMCQKLIYIFFRFRGKNVYVPSLLQVLWQQSRSVQPWAQLRIQGTLVQRLNGSKDQRQVDRIVLHALTWIEVEKKDPRIKFCDEDGCDFSKKKILQWPLCLIWIIINRQKVMTFPNYNSNRWCLCFVKLQWHRF